MFALGPGGSGAPGGGWLGLGLLSEATIAFSRQDTETGLWRVVCEQARWIFGFNRMLLLFPGQAGGWKEGGRHHQGRYTPGSGSPLTEAGDPLSLLLTRPSATWADPPRGVGHDPLRIWLFEDKPRHLLVLPVLDQGQHLAALVFTFRSLSDEERTHRTALASAYALQAALRLRIIRADVARREAERELRESEERFRQIAENIRDAVFWMADPRANRLIYVSPSSEALWGIPPAQLLDAPERFRQGVAPKDADLVPGSLASTAWMQGELAFRYWVTPNGPERWLAMHAWPVGNSQRMAGISRDVTVQKEVERLKDEFLASMSHELRTPLNAIILYGEILLQDAEEQGNTQVIEDLRKIHWSAHHLLGLVNDILDLAKIGAGEVDLSPEPTQLDAFITALKEGVAPLAMKNGNELVFDIAPMEEPLWADPVRLRQVLLNLIGNACKFTEHGRVTVRIRPDGARALFEVIDTGPGMAPAETERLFQQFSQAGPEVAKRYGGTGLGLAISRKLVHLMGGDIGVHSKKGEGSTFWFWLPRRPQDAHPQSAPAVEVKSAASD